MAISERNRDRQGADMIFLQVPALAT